MAGTGRCSMVQCMITLVQSGQYCQLIVGLNDGRMLATIYINVTSCMVNYNNGLGAHATDMTEADKATFYVCQRLCIYSMSYLGLLSL